MRRTLWSLALVPALLFSAAPVASADALEPLKPVPAVDAILRDSFHFFRTPPDPLPRATKANFNAIIAEEEAEGEGLGYVARGLNLELSQRVQPPEGGPPIWVMPQRGGVMVFIQLRPGYTFDAYVTSSRLIRHGTWFNSERNRLVGIVPDDAIAIRLGRDLAVPVNNNAFSIRGRLDDLWRHSVLISARQGAVASR